jgi:hypothetical protein
MHTKQVSDLTFAIKAIAPISDRVAGIHPRHKLAGQAAQMLGLPGEG